ncbi:MAG: GrpB family protein [Bdellovibrionota bacterium]
MLAPHPVEIVAYDPQWKVSAQAESDRLHAALGTSLVTVHHIGSTSVPDLCAKPIIDLIPVFATEIALDDSRPLIESLGYRCWGELGLPGRRFCTYDDPVTHRRRIHLHGYLVDSPEIDRHIAFRNYLRAHSEVAREYERVKQACRTQHPSDSQAYSLCKSDWIKRVERAALETLSGDGRTG